MKTEKPQEELPVILTDIFANDPVMYLRWTEKKINAWYQKYPWHIGCNYIPHYAINQLEMWQKESFNITMIEEELSWAAGLGFNTIRFFFAPSFMGPGQGWTFAKNGAFFSNSSQAPYQNHVCIF